MPTRDNEIDRYANIRRSKLGGAFQDSRVLSQNAQEHWEDECIERVEASVTDSLLLARGYAALTTADRGEGGAAGAGTVLRSDREGSAYSMETAATAGDLIRLETDLFLQQDRGPEIEARFRVAAGAADTTDMRAEIGLYEELGASRNSPVAYAAIVYETGRGNGNLRLHVAGTDFFALSLDASAAAAAELTNETADAQDAGANDVPLGVIAAQADNDGLIFINPRKPKAIVLTVGTAETAVGTYIWQYFGIVAGGAVTAWRTFTPDGTAPTFIAGGTGVGRKVMEIPQTIVDLMRQFVAGDVIGVDATTANLPAGVTAVGNYGVRIQISVSGAGAPPNINWASVEEIVDTEVALVENQWHRIRLRLGSGSGDPAQAMVDNSAWATSPQGAVDAGTAKTLRLAAKLQTFAAEAKRLDIDYWRAFQDRAT